MTLLIELSTNRQSNSHEKMAKSKGPSATVIPFLYTSGSCVLRRTTEAKKYKPENPRIAVIAVVIIMAVVREEEDSTLTILVLVVVQMVLLVIVLVVLVKQHGE